MQSDDTRPLCACGCGRHAKHGHRFITGSHLAARFTHEERFWLDVNRQGPNECWPWLGQVDEKGYGRFMVKGRKIRAHQFSWALHCAPAPDGLEVCHHCDVRPCCNPAHLFVGTHADNMRDAVSKGRMSRGGPKNPRRGTGLSKAKLRNEDIPVIRKLGRYGFPVRQIAIQYGVAHHQIRRVINGTGWTHVVDSDPDIPKVLMDKIRAAIATIRMNRKGAGAAQARGEHVGRAKLKEGDIPVIRDLHQQGLSTREIGRRYSVAHHQIRRILNGTGWKHVQ